MNDFLQVFLIASSVLFTIQVLDAFNINNSYITLAAILGVGYTTATVLQRIPKR